MILPILPILVPVLAAALLLMLPAALLRAVVALSLLVQLGLAITALVATNDGAISVHVLGNWAAPYGITLVLDRLAALMLATSTVVGVMVMLRQFTLHDSDDRLFHVVLQLQLAGLAAAFLTADLFNLFVAFEMLLIASYILLVHGGGTTRIGAGLHYVGVNLVGSALFLVALGLIYGTLGTLSIADIAQRLPLVPAADQALVRVAFGLLLVVFGLKAALMPIGLWLTPVYGQAGPAVAMLFAIMTKVGAYALLRVGITGLAGTPDLAMLTGAPLAVAALLTLVAGIVFVLSARRLGTLVAATLFLSSGSLALMLAHGTWAATAAALFYLPQSTFIACALFLVAGLVGQQRGQHGDSFDDGAHIRLDARLGMALFVLAIAVSGMPPLSGFLGKLALLQASINGPWAVATAALLILSGFAVALSLARAGSGLFWKPYTESANIRVVGSPLSRAEVGLVMLMLSGVVLLTVFAAPISRYAEAAATQLHGRTPYLSAVIPDPSVIQREVRP